MKDTAVVLIYIQADPTLFCFGSSPPSNHFCLKTEMESWIQCSEYSFYYSFHIAFKDQDRSIIYILLSQGKGIYLLWKIWPQCFVCFWQVENFHPTIYRMVSGRSSHFSTSDRASLLYFLAVRATCGAFYKKWKSLIFLDMRRKMNSHLVSGLLLVLRSHTAVLLVD